MLKPRKNVEKLPVYQTDEYFEACKLKLDSNENLFGPSKKVLDCLRQIDEDKIKFYPCYGELLDELAALHTTDKKNILLTNGCDEAVNVIFNTFLNENDCVVSFSPTFAMPKIYATAAGAKFNEIKYDEKWVFDRAKLENYIDSKTKMIYLTSPNSPTGDVIEIDDVSYFCKKYPQKLVVLDVTYLNFIENAPNYYDLLQNFQNLFIIKSFSKDYALAGLRLGYIVSNSENISNLKKIISPYSVNNLAVAAGLCALKDVEHLRAMKAEIAKSREILIKGLLKFGFEPFNSNGNFVLCDFKNSADFIYRKLLINSVKVRRFDVQSPIASCFRITVPKAKDAEQFLKIIAPRNLLVFDMDGVLFDVQNSYRMAVAKTFEHFAFKKLETEEIQEAKNMGGLNSDWDLTEFLLSKHGVKADKKDIITVFQNYFFNPKNEGSKGLIDNERLLIDGFSISKLAERFDLAIFTGRPYDEAFYSLQKNDILKYFNIVLTMEDLPLNRQKPDPTGLFLIKERAIYNKIYYFGDTKDDMVCANMANVTAIGVMPSNAQNEAYKKFMLDNGAKWVLNDINELLKIEV